MKSTVPGLSAPFASALPNDRRHRVAPSLRQRLLGSVTFGSGLASARGSMPKAPTGNRRMRRAAKLGAASGAAASLLMGGTALANPTGGTVAAGNVTISATAPSTLNVTQSTNSAIINWQSFSIGAGEKTNFQLPNASGVTLNRVTGSDPSAIFGQLSSNGTVFLVNPNGVFFGPHSKVDVAGIVATTANISNTDFLAGNYNFGQASTDLNASVVNEGDLSIADRGLAALVAPSVRNSGIIHAKLGRVALGGANSFTLDFWGDGLLSFGAGSAVTTAPKQADGTPVKALVTNTGKIVADGGTVELSARAVKSVVDQSINTDGIIEAKSIGTQNGNIVLGGGDAGTVEVAGTLDASGTTAGSTGGTIAVNGASVELAATAKLDSSGAAGGGKILVGTNAKRNKTAATVTVQKGAAINANARVSGTGGSVTFLSDQSTVFAGSVSARGGTQGGDGGFVEVSSHQGVAFSGSVDLLAPKGTTGTFLLDPSSLEITAGSSNGSLNSSLSGGTLSVGTSDQGSGSTLNTLSQDTLQSLSSTTNILLQATGQITVDAMTGGVLNLQTGTGHSFTLESTTSGGIKFLDPSTQIATNGGAITLEAYGIGSTLSNIGKLSSSGGAITLTATGGISLANAINAGSGAVSIQSVVGSIVNSVGSAATITGGSVALSAASANIGDATNAIDTATTALSLETGGNLYVSNSGTLSSLAVTSAHVLPNSSDVYQVASNGLVFSVTDGASYALTTVDQSGLAFSFTGDRGLALGTVDVGTGALTLSSTAGNLTGTSGTLLTAGNLTLTAQGSTAANGAIGTSATPIGTAVSGLSAKSGTGGIYVANTGTLALGNLTTTGSSTVATSGDLTVGTVAAPGTALTLQSTAGGVFDDGSALTTITAGTLTVNAAGAIGTSGTPLTFTATTLNANAAAGGLYATTGGSVTLSQIVSGNGPITLVTGGSTVATSIVSSTSSSSNPISLTVDSGYLEIGTINAGTSGNVSLATLGTGTNFIESTGSNPITGNVVSISTPTSNSNGFVSVRTAASTLDITAGNSISVTQAGAVTLNTLTSRSSISITDSTGAIAVGSVTAGTSSPVSITASNGAVLDDGSASTLITGSAVSLTSGTGSLGTSSAHLGTDTSSLTLNSHGNIYLDNSTQALASLVITDDHATAGTANILALTSPYLNFAVTDSGSQFTLTDIVGTTLGTLSFTGDETIVAGHVQAGTSSQVSLTASAGDILDDANSQTRITGNTVTLSASLGNIGTAAAPVDLNTTNLTIRTDGNLYLSDIADFANLSVTSTHGSAAANYGYVITAPSLVFNVTDSAGGYAFNTLTDITGLNFTFSGDRAITLGSLDVTRTGQLTFTTSAGNILDDGNTATQAIANGVTLSATAGAIGTSSAPVALVAQTISARAGAGSVYATIPMPTNSATDAATISGSATGGSFNVTAAEGDLDIGSITVSGSQSINLTASNGSLYYGSSYMRAVTGTINLSAAGAIGTTSRPLELYFTGTGGTLNATASGGGIAITALAGSYDVGTINAGSNAVSLRTNSGSILDDGNASTVITGSTVTLTATGGSLGSTTTPLAVVTPSLTASAAGTMEIGDTSTLTTLALTSTSGSSANRFVITAPNFTTTPLAISDSGSQFYLQAIDSSTALAFSFTGSHSIKLGTISTDGAAASITATSGSITADGVATTNITAPTVTLSAANGSIGASGTSGAIALSGTTSLTLTTGANVYVSDDTSLASLALTVDDSSANADVFSIVAPDESFTITDDGSYNVTLTSIGGSGGTPATLDSFSFTGNKNIEIGDIAAGTVQLTTSGGYANGNSITMASGGTGITASTGVTLSATGAYTDAGLSGIGTSGTPILVTTPSLTAKTTANLYVNDSQSLSTLALTVAHNDYNHAGSTEDDTPTYTYSVVDSADLTSFSISDNGASGITLSNIASSSPLAFGFSADRALQVGTIDVGSGSTGAVTLVSTGNYQSPSNAFPVPSIEGVNGSNRITAGTVSLSATQYQGDVGGSTAINVTTASLAVASSGSISVADNQALTALSLTPNIDNQSDGATYAITATNLSSSNISYDDTYGLRLNDIVVSSGTLALTVNTSGQLTVDTINTGSGAGSSVSLTAGGAIQGITTSALITTGDLTLNASSVDIYSGGNAPLDTAASSLAGTITNSIILSNAGDLTLHSLTVGSSATLTVTGNASFLSDGTSYLTVPTAVLTAAGTSGGGGSIGASGTPLLTDVQNLTTTIGRDLYVSNLVDLYSLNITANHVASGRQSVIQVTAPSLVFNVTDEASGTEFDIATVTDATGLDFSFTGDKPIDIGTINGQYGRNVSISSTGGGIFQESGAEQITADTIALSATGSIGTSGGHIATNALALAVTSGANIYVDNSLDLSSLAFTTTQSGTTSPASYSITSGTAFGGGSATLDFQAADNGTTLTLSTVTDTTGLNFTATAQHPMDIGTIDLEPSAVQASGTLSLIGYGGVFGIDSSNHLTAANTTLTTWNSTDIGTSGTPLNLSSPLLTLDITGSVYLNSDTHIDALTVDSTHPNATYGTYSIVSPDLSYSATDSSSGTSLSNITDTTGLAFSYTSDTPIIVGTINLGSVGTVALRSTASGNAIVGDGTGVSTEISAASLTMTADAGAIGGTGTGQEIDADVNTLGADAQDGGVALHLTGPASLSGITAHGAMSLVNNAGDGDIALGSINLNGYGLTVDNEGGSILSGSLSNTAAVSLTAAGSIGNISAIQFDANGDGTTTLTAVAQTNARGATGSINIAEDWNLNAASVTGPGTITLSAGRALSVGTINAGSSAVTLTASEGAISGDSTSNSVTGDAVTLSAEYYNAQYSIGSSGTPINVVTSALVLNNQSNIYVADTAALNSLTINRAGNNGGSSGAISVSASGLTASISDGSTTTISSLSDSGLDFAFYADHSISVGTINVGSGGTVTLSAAPYEAAGSITATNGSSLITAGTLSLAAYDYSTNASSIGTSGQFLPIAVTSITGSAGAGGIYLTQAGSIDLSSLTSGGALSVTTTSGDITIGTLSYGNGQALTLNAAGSIYAGSGTLYGGSANTSNVYGAISLTAVDGIGTSAAPILISAPGNGTTGNAVSATVTGSGNIYLDSTTALPGGLTTSAVDGATSILSSGSILLSNLTSATDDAADAISVLASSGNITYATLSGGTTNGDIALTANAGQILAVNSSATMSAFAIDLYGADGVGNSTTSVIANGQRVDVTSQDGALYLATTAPTALAYLDSNGGAITITPAADLLLANAISGGGTITVAGGTVNTLTAGNINAGSGTVSLTDGTIIDDGLSTTRVVGGTVTLTTTNGIGASSSSPVETTAGTLNASVSGAGGLFIDDNGTTGLTLSNISTSNGAIAITAAGPLTATSVTSSTDATVDGISLTTSSGDLTVQSVTAGTGHGTVTLTDTAGSILASGSGPNITAHDATLAATDGSIGTLTSFTGGSGTPITLAVTTIDGLTAGATGGSINVSEAGNLTLSSGILTLGTNGAAYIAATGNLDASAGLTINSDSSLALVSGQTLTLPTASFSTSGGLYFKGVTDVVESGGGRTITETAGSLKLVSGASGGDTTLDTTAVTLDISLTGAAALTVANTGTLSSLTLATSNGNITMTDTLGFTATSVTAGGSGRTVQLTATNGTLTAATVNAGSGGTIDLTATNGSIAGTGNFTTGTLNLVAGTAIGSVDTPFSVNVTGFSAQVTGTGGIYVQDTGALTLGATSTANGDIVISSAGTFNAANAITAGGGGNISLTSTGGALDLTGALTTTGTDATKGNLTLGGTTIAVGTVQTVGAQTYNGNTTVTGDLTGAAIQVNGTVTLTTADQTFDTHATDGNIAVTGGVAGAGHGLTLDAGTGTVSLGGAATGLSTLTVTAGSLALDGVSTTGAQSYSAPMTLSGTFAISGPGAFTVNGTATLGGATTVTTNGGNVEFGSTIDGGQSLTINPGAGNITLGGAVGGTTRLGALTLTSTGAIAFDSSIKAASVTTSGAGTLTLDGGLVHTTGIQSYAEAPTLGADTTLTATTVSFAQAVDAATAGQQGLTINGNAVFSGAVGANEVLKSLAVSGTTVLDGNVDTTGTQSYGGATVLGTTATLNGTTVSFGSTLDATTAGAQGLTIDGNAVLAGTVGGSKALAALTISGTSTLEANITTVGAQDYVGAVTLASDPTLTTTNAAVVFGSTIDGPQSLTVSTGTGNVSFDAAVGGTTRLGALVVDSSGATLFTSAVDAASVTTDAGGSLAINGGVVNTTGAQSYGEATTLGADTMLTATTVSFGSTVDAATASQQGLTLNAGAVFDGAVGGTQALKTLTVTGGVVLDTDTTVTAATASFGGTIDAATAGQQGLTINGNAAFDGTIGAIAALKAFAVSGNVVLDGDTAVTAATASFGGTIDGTTAGRQSLTIAGATVLDGVLGGTTGLKALTVNGGLLLGTDMTVTATTASFGGTIDATTAGQQGLTINGNAVFDGAIGGTTALKALAVTGNTVLDADTGVTAPTARFGGTIDATTAGQQGLTINGNAVFDGAIGGTTALKALAVTGSTVLDADTGVTATTASFGGTIDAATAGHQGLAITGNATFDGAIGGTNALKTLAVTGSTLLDTGLAVTATTATFGGTIDAATAGTQGLTIDGNAVLAGTVGGSKALAALTISGTSTLEANITTVGTQNYVGAVTLASDPALTTTNAAVVFGSTIDGSQALTVSTGTGAVTFTGAIGATARLGALVVDSAGATTFTSTVKAASVSTDAPGTVAINGGLVDTTGSQSYGELATLGADTVLNATSVTFGGALDAASAGQQGLTINGNGTFASAVGANRSLKSLTVTGAAAIEDGAITTTGAQSYGNGSSLGADTTLDGTLVSFTGSLDGTVAGQQGLTINGNAMFDGSVGGTTSLQQLSVTGTTALNGATITTSDAQNYAAAVTVGSTSSLTSQAGALQFASTIDSGNRAGLTLAATDGDIVIAGAVGSSGALGALSIAKVTDVSFGGAIDASSLAVTASGTPQFQGAILADGSGGITLNGNSFTFLNPITASAGALTVNLGTGGSLAVAATAPINAASGFIETETGTSTITLASDITAQKGPIRFAGSPTLIGSALAFETNGLISFTGLAGGSTNLTLIAGPTGSIVIGQPNTTNVTKLAVLKSLIVPANGTGTATLYGTLGGDSGALPASEVSSPLRGANYTYNNFPWGPSNLIGTITVTVPTRTPTAATNIGFGPNSLNATQPPEVLTFAGNNSLLGVSQSQNLLNIESGNGMLAPVFGTSQPLLPGETAPSDPTTTAP